MSRFGRIFSKAELNRRENRKQKRDGMQRNACALADSAPRVDPSALADAADGTLWADILKDPAKDLVIEIYKWNLAPPPGEFDALYVYHQIGTAGPKEEIYSGQFAAGDASKFPLPVKLDKHDQSYLADGDHLFFYEIELYSGVPPQPSDTLKLRFDRMGPNEGQPPKEVPSLPVITDANVGSIELTLPDYSDRATGDQVFWWISKEIPEGEPTLPPEGDAPVTQADQKLPVRQASLQALGDGEAWVAYLLIDKAGNKSLLSLLTKVSITLGALPTVLLPPEVPLAQDGLVDREDAMQGIIIEIPDITNFKSTDEFNPRWGIQDLGWRPIGLGAFPIPVSVDSAVVREQYGQPEVGTKGVNVSYQVRRGIETQGDAFTVVDVNFEMIGPVDPGPDPDPEWPDPVNPRLPLPHVYGQGSTTPDLLGPEHDQLDASLEFELYEGLMEDDEVQFFWGGEHIVGVDYTVLDTDKAGDLRSIEILWEYINRTGNTTVPVHYEIKRTTVPNKGISGKQGVVVNAIVIHPDAPEFVGVNASGWMTCSALDVPADPSIPPAILVTVEDLSQYGLTDGSTVHLYWWALHSTSGDDEVIDWDEEITLGVNYPVTGFNWRIPYEDYVLPIYEFDSNDHSGRGFVRYEFESALTASGKRVPVISDEGMAKFAMHGTTDPCDLP
ncbi:hypothetical protein [Pseudomonas sp. NBRC 111124]|uniref:hypothetical protein n=1 Tax=Pseudomonas sp. NBRC 111124 TaxID=1661039 RepID=UPI000761F1FA|nr:hypothetical protein [Pseudomonas sp. NBRC 111124]